MKVCTHLRAGQYSPFDANPLNFAAADADCTKADLVNSAAPDGMVTLQGLSEKQKQNLQMLMQVLNR